LISNRLLPPDRSSLPKSNSSCQENNARHSERFSQSDIAPPDFSQLRQALVTEPANKFVPPRQEEKQQELTPNACDE
jgi:hypothetical protein